MASLCRVPTIVASRPSHRDSRAADGIATSDARSVSVVPTSRRAKAILKSRDAHLRSGRVCDVRSILPLRRPTTCGNPGPESGRLSSWLILRCLCLIRSTMSHPCIAEAVGDGSLRQQGRAASSAPHPRRCGGRGRRCGGGFTRLGPTGRRQRRRSPAHQRVIKVGCAARPAGCGHHWPAMGWRRPSPEPLR